MKITIKAIQAKAVLNFIIQVSVKALTEVSIDDVISNNNNNSKSMENNIAECDVDTTVFIVDDANKIKDCSG